MTPSSLEQLFRGFDQKKVLVVGDVMIDSYLWGEVNRISPEAPVPIVQVKERDKRPGGAANVALNVKAMGAAPFLCAVIGDDEDGDALMSSLTDAGVVNDGIVRSKHRKTTVKHRIIAGSQHLLRVDAEDTHALNKQEEEGLIEKVFALLPDMDVVIFEDYDKGVLTPEGIRRIIDQATKYKIPTIVDPKKNNFLHYKGATLFKPNLKELKEGLHLELKKSDIAAVQHAVDVLREKMPVEAVMVTLSEHGVLVKSSKETHHLSAHIRKIADVSGAGDTVVAVAALGLASGMSLDKLTALANLAGGLVCEYVGVVPVDKSQLLLEAGKLFGLHNKAS